MVADLVVTGGWVVDGTGGPRVRADVAVTGGRVTEVGPGLEGRERLDADGLVVAPGFIDIHTHYDAQVFFEPALTPSSHHGVTTVVAGNCGFSIAPTRPELRELVARTLENVEDMDFDVLLGGVPWDFVTFAEYLASVRQRGSVLNFGAYIGHTALRLFAMGEEAYERTATADEVAAMERELADAMVAGAAGFATSFAPPHNGAGGRPVPSRFADRAEFEALLPRHGGRPDAAWCRSRPARPSASTPSTTSSPASVSRSPTAPCSPARAGTHERLVEVNRSGWARRRPGVAAGDPAAARLLVHHGRAVPPQRQPSVPASSGRSTRAPAATPTPTPSGGRWPGSRSPR